MPVTSLVGVEWLAWSPRFKDYSQENIMCQGSTFAFTSHGDWRSITFCPISFEFPRRKHTLGPWRNGQRTIADGTNMQSALSTPALFLHELMHMVNRASKLTSFTWPLIQTISLILYPKQEMSGSLIPPTEKSRPHMVPS